ncbi:MAG: phage tail tape measure protein, partial [Candidatus Omnitrophica bacterium]|nr:phage tail tape measure protein [Candidatus Omnitrophota bacterium]
MGQISDQLKGVNQSIFKKLLTNYKEVADSLDNGGKINVVRALAKDRRLARDLKDVNVELKKDNTPQRQAELEMHKSILEEQRATLSGAIQGQHGVSLGNIYTGKKRLSDVESSNLNLRTNNVESFQQERTAEQQKLALRKKRIEKAILLREQKKTQTELDLEYANNLKPGDIVADKGMLLHGAGYTQFTRYKEEGGVKYAGGIDSTGREGFTPLSAIANPDRFRSSTGKGIVGDKVRIGSEFYGATAKQLEGGSTAYLDPEDIKSKTDKINKYKSNLESLNKTLESTIKENADRAKLLSELKSQQSKNNKIESDAAKGMKHISELGDFTLADAGKGGGRPKRSAKEQAERLSQANALRIQRYIGVSRSEQGVVDYSDLYESFGVKKSEIGTGGAPPNKPPNKPPGSKDIFDSGSNNAKKFNNAVREADGVFGDFKKHFEQKLSSLGYYTMAGTVIYGLSTAIKQLYNDTITYEKEIVESTRLFGYASTEARLFGSEISTLGIKFGVSIIDAAKAAKVFAQQGFTMGQTLDLVSASLMMSRVGSIEATKATEYLTGAMGQFEIPASKAMGIVEEFTAIANKHAVTIDDLGQGMMRAGATAKIFGVSMRELAGMITAVQTVTRRGGSVIGTSLNFTMNRMFSAPSIKVLKDVGIETNDTNGALRDATSVLSELSAKWGALSSTQQRSIGLAMAGQRQFAQFAALMMNWKEGLTAVQEAADSAGSAQEQLNRIMDTSAASLTQSWNRIQKGAMKFISPLAKMIAAGESNISNALSGAHGTGIQLGAVGGVVAGGLAVAGRMGIGRDEQSQAQIKIYNEMNRATVLTSRGLLNKTGKLSKRFDDLQIAN